MNILKFPFNYTIFSTFLQIKIVKRIIFKNNSTFETKNGYMYIYIYSYVLFPFFHFQIIPASDSPQPFFSKNLKFFRFRPLLNLNPLKQMAFQPAFNARLINEVRKYPCLYNHSRRGSGDTMERQRLWESIAKNIDPNCAAEFAKKRWLQLRDRYRKELKIAIKNGFVTPVRWCYFNQLSWLDPFLKDNM